MRPIRRGDGITLVLLGSGIAVPFLYYGVQVVAAPFFAGFSVLGTTASELGSDRSTRPWIFNTGAILTGIAAIVASVGFLRGLRRLGVPRILSWLPALAVAMTGASSLWAGIYPLPDPRHGGHPSLLIAMIAVPFVLAPAMWRVNASRAHKVCFAATIILLLVMIPIMSGMTGLDTHPYRGLLQRVFALTVFVPIGVGAVAVARRLRGAPSGHERSAGASHANLLQPAESSKPARGAVR
jgi:hypothetical membrane protein